MPQSYLEFIADARGHEQNEHIDKVGDGQFGLSRTNRLHENHIKSCI